MFSIRIHSLESPPEIAGEVNDAPSTSRNPDCRLRIFHGLLRMYRNSSPPSFSSSPSSSTKPPQPPPSSVGHLPAGRGTHLLILAVPGRLTLDDFERFCGAYIKRATGVWVIRNDAIEDRYSVLVEFGDQRTADKFYLGVNGWTFTSKGEVCHALFIDSVKFMQSTDTAETAPAGSIELPTCPVCIERLDQEMSSISATNCDNSFQSPCISKWVHSSCSVCQFCQKNSDKPACSICGTSQNLLICVICGFVGCGRYRKGHAERHWKDTQHSFSLDLETQQIWDYACHSCGHNDDSERSEDLLCTKIKVTKDEYSHLLASQLENQKQYYETLIQEKKAKKGQHISEAVKKAVNLKMRDIQLQINEFNREIKTITAINKKLEKEQKLWRKKFYEAELRAMDSMEMIDTEEEVMDYVFFIETQLSMDNGHGTQGETELPKSATPPSSGNANRSSKRSRRLRR